MGRLPCFIRGRTRSEAASDLGGGVRGTTERLCSTPHGKDSRLRTIKSGTGVTTRAVLGPEIRADKANFLAVLWCAWTTTKT